MDLLIFNGIVNDPCIKGVLEKDNITVLRNIIEFSETEGVTDGAVREYVATRLASDDNILSRLAQANKRIGEDLYKLPLLIKKLNPNYRMELRQHAVNCFETVLYCY